MDFVEVKQSIAKNNGITVYPEFKVKKSKDLMVRGGKFYAIWDAAENMWTTDEYEATRLVDEKLFEYANELKRRSDTPVTVKVLSEYSSYSWEQFRKYMSSLSNNFHQLDESITFADQVVTKEDYVSKRVNYAMKPGDISNFDKLMGTLYDKDEREKLEWTIGCILAGDSKYIQKFVVLFGKAGSGKSTVLNLMQDLFDGYVTTFEAKSLTGANNNFATEVFRNNPLVAIQHDGDLSRIEDNSKLNSIVSHEDMVMNEKYKSSYTSRANCFLLMGTNKPVKITDAKSGLIRRLIDVRPSNRKLKYAEYMTCTSNLKFELGAIAYHCRSVYEELGPQYYENYKPLSMIEQTDVFHNFMLENYFIFKEQDGTSVRAAYEMYKQFCDENMLEFKMPQHKFKAELDAYFKQYDDQKKVDGNKIRSYFSGFRLEMFESKTENWEQPKVLLMEDTESIFDKECSDCPAQYGSAEETPQKKWEKVTSKLSDLNTSELHYVRVPENHIVIDFDLKDEDGNKSYVKNIEAASKWPETYSEISKGGNGVHLHYIWDGDVDTLSRVFEENIEVKVFKGNSALRRKLSRCHNAPIKVISSGLPLKGEKMIDFNVLQNEKAIRTIIAKNLDKQYHDSTRPSIDFIYKTLEDAFNSGMSYDVRDLRQKVLSFASYSTNQAAYCVSRVATMHFCSDTTEEKMFEYNGDDIVFYDVEVFPNLFVVVWKRKGKNKVKLINPSVSDIESMLRMKLVGFNNRRYDNHILYAKILGYNNAELYNLSQKIVNNNPNALFAEAYNLSFADIYEFSSKKQSLKKFEIELGIHHDELGLPWDKPVPEELWERVAEYCGNDVDATEATFEARKADFMAREILAELSNLPINAKTQTHAEKIIFGNDPRPQDKFIYTDLSEIFKGYKYEFGKSTYKNVEVGEGGRVFARPGMYRNVALLDIESQHPNSLIQLNHFGPYTQNFADILTARLSIKHKDFETAKTLLGGILAKYLTNEADAENLQYALKIVINIVYGMTSAKFDNKFKDPNNIDNIVAKRGALFMVDLQEAVEAEGYIVAHIKTDSIKIPDADDYIIQFVKDFGKKFGYTFDHETTYSKMCLVNNAVYIAKVEDNVRWGKKAGKWTATGAQFAQPYVFKTLFSKEEITLEDLAETKQVKTAMYLDMSEVTGNPDDKRFIGKVGQFSPVKESASRGGILLREKDGKFSAVTGTKDWRWLETSEIRKLGLEDSINMDFYKNQVDEAISSISEYGDIEWFMNSEEVGDEDELPWIA